MPSHEDLLLLLPAATVLVSMILAGISLSAQVAAPERDLEAIPRQLDAALSGDFEDTAAATLRDDYPPLTAQAKTPASRRAGAR